MRDRHQITVGGLFLGLLVAAAFPACEKGTRWAADEEFRGIQEQRSSPSERARALEEFIVRYPEPKTNPNLTRAFLLLAAHYDRAGKHAIAASWYERAVRVDPDDPDLMNALGYLYARQGMNIDRAVVLLETAVRLVEERDYPLRRQGLIKDSLGWAYRARGDLPLAVVVLEEACRLAPGVAILREHLAATYRDIGETEKAAAIYLELFLDGRGTNRRLRTILEQLDRSRGKGPSLRIARRVTEGLEAIDERDRRETEALGATLVQLTAEDGYRLRGSLYLPKEGTTRRPAQGSTRGGAVLLLHALGSDREASADLARALAERGLVALSIDLRGHGASVSEAIPTSFQFSESLEENLNGAALDSRAAIRMLERHPRVDRERIGAVGAGMGALLAARVIAGGLPRRTVALVILSPWGITAAYRDAIDRLQPEDMLLLAGRDEADAAATNMNLARDRGVPRRRVLVAPVEGSGFTLTAADPGSRERAVSFLAGRLR